MITIAFDIDGTLIHQIGENEDAPRYDIISLLQFFVKNKNKVYVWSGGGINHTIKWCRKLGLKEITIIEKGCIKPDIVFDNEEVRLGKVNIRV